MGHMGARLALWSTVLTTLASCGQPQETADTKMIIGTKDWDTSVDGQDVFPYDGAAVSLNNGGCSAGFIAGQFLLTAGHCVSKTGTGSIKNRFSGSQSVRVWARSDFEGSNVHDWAILVASDPVGLSAGSASIDFVDPAAGQTTTVVGYPGQLSGTLARSDGTIKELLESGQRYGHDADITTGSSGSFMGQIGGGSFRINGLQSWHWWPNASAQSSQQCSSYVTGSCANAAVAITQFRDRIAEARSLESMRVVGDFSGDGKNELMVRDANGVAFVQVEDDGSLREGSRLTYGAWYGGWHFGQDDELLLVSAFTSGQGAQILVRSAWGLGLLKMERGTWTSNVLYPYGTRIGGWLLGADDTIVGAGRFMADGRQSFVIRSPWGIGLMRLNGNALENVMLVPHGTDFGSGWNFSFNDAVLGVLPLTYGQDRLLLRNSQGMATIYFDSYNGYRPKVAARMNYGQRFPGGWLLGPDDVVVALGGDTNADGYSEFAIRSAWGIGVIDAAFKGVALMPYGSRADGGWIFGNDDQIVGFIGDGSGRGSSLLLQSPWGLGLLGTQNNVFVTRYLAAYGTRFNGGWLFGRRDRVATIGNVVGSNGALEEIVIRSAWGLGVLKYDARSRQLVTHGLWSYGTRTGDWTLGTGDFIPAR